MKRGKKFQYLVLWMAALGLCMPQIAIADTAEQPQVINDLVLQQGGLMVGHVVNPENSPMSNVQVALYGKNKQLATSTTDANGRFVFTGLNNGVYEVATPNARSIYRAWHANVAPPAAERSALIVNGSDIVRGQGPARGLRIPLIVAGLVATAIAVPVAIHNSQSKSPVSE